MAWFDFIWTYEIIDHLARHDVTPDEFEEVVQHPVLRGKSRTSDRSIADGYTSSGRYIRCVYEELDDGVTIIPVTAYEY